MANIVVVGVDESTTAAKAAHKAAALAAGLGAGLVVVSAFDDTEAAPDMPADLAPVSINDLALHVAERAITSLRADFPDLDMRPRAEYGKPAKTLVAVAEEVDATVIVVGNKRVQGLAAVLGSIARDVAHHAPCDVYIAHTVER